MRSDVIRIGGESAVAVAVLYVMVGFNSVVAPNPQTFEAMMRTLVESPIYHYVWMIGFALIAICFIPAMMAMQVVLGDPRAGLMRWATIIGYMGCAGTIMSTTRLLYVAPLRARAFLEGDEVVRAVIQYSWTANDLDPVGWMQYGAVGAWLLVASLVALREGKLFPRGWSYLGIAGAIIHFAILASYIAFPQIQALAAFLGAFVIAPIWGIWTGRELRRLSENYETLELSEGKRLKRVS